MCYDLSMPVRWERRGRIGIVTLDRQEKRNAIDAEMSLAIEEALNGWEDDSEIRVGIITGGSKVFCAGTDIAGGSGEPPARGGEYGVIRRKRNKPLIAAIEGVAFGGGLEIALACDLVVASRTARLGLPEVRRGLVATSGGLFRAPRALPIHVAKELLLTGAELDVERAERLGLVNRIVEPGEALAMALEMAEAVAENSPVAVRETLLAIEATASADDGEGWRATQAARQVIEKSEDAKEGIRAFFERRTPEWPGR